jgi:alpha-beta hydrolase superfamily lysophospholipase
MHSKNIVTNERWKCLAPGVQVTQFSSTYGKGHHIYVKHIQSPSKTPKVKIFLFHDVTSYHGRFMNLVRWFQVRNPEVAFVMIDFLGHGLSTGTRGHIPDFKILCADTESLYRLIDQDFGKVEGEKWVSLGHGMGALAVLDFMNRADEHVKEMVDELILSNFVLNFTSPLFHIDNQFFNNFKGLKKALSHIRPIEIYKAEEMLSHSDDQTNYLEDPLISRKPTYLTFQKLAEKVSKVYQDAYFLDKPTLLLKSSSPYHFGNGAESFSKGFKKELLLEKKYFNLKHDLYNEKDNLIVFNDIVEWLER